MTQSKARVHTTFESLLSDTQQIAKAQAASPRDGSPTPWAIPSLMQAGHVYDVDAVATAFDRQDINTNYEECFQTADSPGTVGDIVGLKLQLTRVAMEERAFRFRHESTIRCLSHANARRAGLGNGPRISRVRDEVADAIQAGATS